MKPISTISTKKKYIINARIPKLLFKKNHSYIETFSSYKYKFFFCLFAKYKNHKLIIE